MQPRQIRETLSPVLPRLTYSIAPPSNCSDRPGHNHPWSSVLPLHMSLPPPETIQRFSGLKPAGTNVLALKDRDPASVSASAAPKERPAGIAMPSHETRRR